MLIKKISSMLATCVLMTSVSSIGTLLLISGGANAAELSIKVSDIDVDDADKNNDKGYLMVALYSDKSSYNSGKSQWSSMVKVSKTQEIVTFSNLPNGTYAIKMFHDENENKKLDKNILGIPSEGYGFSNNKGQFGQPEFDEASFNVADNTEIAINLF